MTQTKETNFEKSMERLGDIVHKLEDGELSLDEALKLYEEGIHLSQACAKRLENAQSRVDILMQSASGQIQAAEANLKDLKPKGKKKK
jgi:exodeoxyribonuclease VII small subunit